MGGRLRPMQDLHAYVKQVIVSSVLILLILYIVCLSYRANSQGRMRQRIQWHPEDGCYAFTDKDRDGVIYCALCDPTSNPVGLAVHYSPCANQGWRSRSKLAERREE